MECNKEKQRADIEKFILKMPSLSTTVGKVMEICSRTDTSPNELHKVISLDPILAGQVMKLINSAYYSLINKVTSLTRAITMLGMNTVKNIALSTAIIRTVSGVKKTRALPTAKFWEHSISTGVSARLLGEIKGYSPMEREELFLAGLLHDLGNVPFGDEYIEVLNVARNEQQPLVEVERALLGIDHQEVGMMIAKKWKLNKVITECITRHHQVDTLEGDYRQHVALISLGNIYSNIFDHGYAGDPFPDEGEVGRLLDVVHLDHDVFTAISDMVVEEIERSKLFLLV